MGIDDTVKLKTSRRVDHQATFFTYIAILPVSNESIVPEDVAIAQRVLWLGKIKCMHAGDRKTFPLALGR